MLKPHDKSPLSKRGRELPGIDSRGASVMEASVSDESRARGPRTGCAKGLCAGARLANPTIFAHRDMREH